MGGSSPFQTIFLIPAPARREALGANCFSPNSLRLPACKRCSPLKAMPFGRAMRGLDRLCAAGTPAMKSAGPCHRRSKLAMIGASRSSPLLEFRLRRPCSRSASPSPAILQNGRRIASRSSLTRKPGMASLSESSPEPKAGPSAGIAKDAIPVQPKLRVPIRLKYHPMGCA